MVMDMHSWLSVELIHSKVNDIFVGDSTLYTITFFVYFSFAPKEYHLIFYRVAPKEYHFIFIEFKSFSWNKISLHKLWCITIIIDMLPTLTLYPYVSAYNMILKRNQFSSTHPLYIAWWRNKKKMWDSRKGLLCTLKRTTTFIRVFVSGLPNE